MLRFITLNRPALFRNIVSGCNRTKAALAESGSKLPFRPSLHIPRDDTGTNRHLHKIRQDAGGQLKGFDDQTALGQYPPSTDIMFMLKAIEAKITGLQGQLDTQKLKAEKTEKDLREQLGEIQHPIYCFLLLKLNWDTICGQKTDKHPRKRRGRQPPMTTHLQNWQAWHYPSKSQMRAMIADVCSFTRFLLEAADFVCSTR